MDKRDSIISVVTAPLGFFALSLLIIEGFLGIIVIGSGSTLSSDAKTLGMYLAMIAFGGITAIVALMVWLIPENLTLRGEDWMDKAKLEKNWADSNDPKTRIEVEKLESTTV